MMYILMSSIKQFVAERFYLITTSWEVLSNFAVRPSISVSNHHCSLVVVIIVCIYYHLYMISNPNLVSELQVPRS